MNMLVFHIGQSQPDWFELAPNNHTVKVATDKSLSISNEVIVPSLEFSDILIFAIKNYTNFDCIAICSGNLYVDFVKLEKSINQVDSPIFISNKDGRFLMIKSECLFRLMILLSDKKWKSDRYLVDSMSGVYFGDDETLEDLHFQCKYSFSIITPTIARDDLSEVCRQTLSFMGEFDEHIIIGDGVNAESMIPSDERFVYKSMPKMAIPGGTFYRQYAIQLASRRYLVNVDDDDRMADNSLDTIRSSLVSNPDVPHAFSMKRKDRVFKNSLSKGCIGGPQFVCRNLSGMMGDWLDKTRLADWKFITETVKKYNGQCCMHDEIIYFVRPDQ